MAPSDPPRPPPPLPSVTLETSRARLLAQRNTSPTSRAPPPPAKPLPSLLQRLPASVQPSLQTTLSKLSALASSRQGTNPSFRVGQLDAELLDEELLTLLTAQVGDSLKYFGRHISTDWKSEIHLVLRSILFKLSIWDHDASYGASLQGLKYIDGRSSAGGLSPPSRWQKGIYGLVSVFGTYGFTKWEDWLIKVEAEEGEPPAWVPRAESLTRWASNVHAVAATVSFCVFLVNGRYRTLLDRVLGLKLAAPSAQIAREVSFEYLNRQLVWHAFTEFLLFLLPLMGVSKWRKWLSRGWRRTKKLVKQASRDGNDEEDEEMKGELHHLPERTCAICYAEMNPSTTSEAELMALGGMSGAGGVVGDVTTDITNPYETVECGHVYCYVCISKRIEAEGGDGWQCLRCGETVMRARPWNGDVILPVVEEEEIRTANGNGDADASEKNKIVKSVRFGDEDENDEDNEAHEEGGEVGMGKTRTLDLGPAGAEESLLDDEKTNGDESMYFSGISNEDDVERTDDDDERRDDGSNDLFA